MTDNTIHPQITRHGLNELLNLPEGVRDAITHIGLSTARFTPTAETTAVQNEVLRIAISDTTESGDNAIQFYAAIADNEWSGNMTAIYTIAFYLSTGTLLAVWSNPNEVEALLRQGRSEEFYYTFALDALPADKIEIISTQRVFNPGIVEQIAQHTLASIRQTLTIDDHATQLKQHDSQIGKLSFGLQSVNDALPKLRSSSEQIALITESNTSRLQDHDLALYSMMLARRRILAEMWQPGLVSGRAHGLKGDPWQVEYEPDHVTFAMNTMHDHPDILASPLGYPAKMSYTFGTAELGIYMQDHVQTRHLDPVFVTPVIGSSEFLATKTVQAPPIPPAILAKTTVAEQIAEAREWMRAFAERDITIRDYRPYVDVHLLVMEGWDQVTPVEDASLSFRHGEEESDVYDLHDASAVYQVTGAKPILENKTSPVSGVIAHKGLPGTVITTVYRMHTTRLGNIGEANPDECLYINDDPAVNYRKGKTQTETDTSVHYGVRHEQGIGDVVRESVSNETLINKWMRKVSGLSNGKHIPFELSEPNKPVYRWTDPNDRTTELNAGYYTNYYALPDDAVGRNVARTGWREASKWVALNDRPEVVPWVDPHTGIEYRVSYAVPWEIVLLGWWNNPAWNPRNIEYKTSKTQRYGGITGTGTKIHPFNGWNEDHRGCVLPYELFDSVGLAGDPADTGKGVVYAKSTDGNVYAMANAGIRILTLPVAGKQRRCRYPIMPIAWHGNPLYKYIKTQRLNENTALAMASIRQTLAIDDANQKQKAADSQLERLTGLIETTISRLNSADENQKTAANDINALVNASIRQTLTNDGVNLYDN